MAPTAHRARVRRCGFLVRASVPSATPLRVLRLCSVFEPPWIGGHRLDPRFDPVGGMQSHTGELTRALDRRPRNAG
jgi:hypothetical protein